MNTSADIKNQINKLEKQLDKIRHEHEGQLIWNSYGKQEKTSIFNSNAENDDIYRESKEREAQIRQNYAKFEKKYKNKIAQLRKLLL
jgi:hypothetical protein